MSSSFSFTFRLDWCRDNSLEPLRCIPSRTHKLRFLLYNNPHFEPFVFPYRKIQIQFSIQGTPGQLLEGILDPSFSLSPIHHLRFWSQPLIHSLSFSSRTLRSLEVLH